MKMIVYVGLCVVLKVKGALKVRSKNVKTKQSKKQQPSYSQALPLILLLLTWIQHHDAMECGKQAKLETSQLGQAGPF